MTGKRSTSSALIPLAILNPGDGDQPFRSCTNGELVVASPAQSAAFSPHFRLPDDWTVKKQPRRSSLQGKFDTYYYEPGTGRQFRSLISVQKHLIEMKQGLLTSGTRKPVNEREVSRLRALREMQIVSRTSHIELPEGWIVEEKPRSNINYAGHVDKYYIEPGTGRRFRSLLSAKRYLAELEEYSSAPKALTSNQFIVSPSNGSDSLAEDISGDDCSLQVLRNLIKAKKKLNPSRALKPANHSTPLRATSSQEKNVSVEKDNASVLGPPAKINWVLTSTGGNLFSPFMGDYMVPEFIKQKWSEAFTLAVCD